MKSLSIKLIFSTPIPCIVCNTEVKLVSVDTGAELSWLPADLLESLAVTRVKRLRFRQVDGSVTRGHHANAIIALRCCLLNGELEDYWAERLIA